MKRILALTTALTIVCGINADARRGVLVTHYGSSDPETRTKTLDRITSDIRDALPGLEVREAYISPVVRQRLEQRGEAAESPAEALLRMRADGFDTVYVQSTTIIDGAEMAEVRTACGQVAEHFGLLKCGEPLCYTPGDCESLAAVLAAEPRRGDEAIVYVGHGNMLPSTATYCQLDYALRAMGHRGYYVSTIEGYPTAESTASIVRRDDRKVKKVRLVPLLLVCGNHTKNDIAGEFAESLRKNGFEPEVMMRGLGENAAVRTLYVDKALRLVE